MASAKKGSPTLFDFFLHKLPFHSHINPNIKPRKLFILDLLTPQKCASFIDLCDINIGKLLFQILKVLDKLIVEGNTVKYSCLYRLVSGGNLFH